MTKVECKTDFLVVKYFVKALLRNDKFQIGVDPKKGFKQCQ